MNLCSLEDCNRPVRAKKLCGSHYQKSIAKPKAAPKSRKPDHSLSQIQEDGTALCAVCGPIDRYYTNPTSGQRRCPVPERLRSRSRTKTPWYGNRYFFADGQSVSHAEAVAARLRFEQEQDGCCAICKRHESVTGTLALDHCHDTGKLRGLLCMDCNKGLGFFRDSAEALATASEYLTR